MSSPQPGPNAPVPHRWWPQAGVVGTALVALAAATTIGIHVGAWHSLLVVLPTLLAAATGYGFARRVATDASNEPAPTVVHSARTSRDRVTIAAERHAREAAAIANEFAAAERALSTSLGEQSTVAHDMRDSVETMLDAAVGISDAIGPLGVHAQETASSVASLDGSIWQIAENTEALRLNVDEAASATSELSAAVSQIADGAVSLGGSSDATNERIGRLERSIRSVESNADHTHRVSEEALAHARSGIAQVQELTGGMREIDKSFRGVQERIDGLAERSASIEGIVGLIDEIVSRTHLLALNASIIAAQAGEQGRAFSVVATEVRSLADLTADSTKEIAGHVAGVRDQIDQAVEAAEVGAARVASGRSLSEATAESLSLIHDGSEQATAMTREIADATEEQSAELAAVKASMADVSNLIQQIVSATREQNESSHVVLERLDQMREVAQQVAEGCSRQATGSRQMTEAAAALAEGISDISRATAGQSERGMRVLEGLQQMASHASGGAVQLERLAAGASDLAVHSDALLAEVESDEA